MEYKKFFWLKEYIKTIHIGHQNLSKIMLIGQSLQFLTFILMTNVVHPFMISVKMENDLVMSMRN